MGIIEVVASAAVATAFGVLYTWALHCRHLQYDTYAFDLGLLGQVAWNNLHGHWFDTTVMPFNYLAEHFSPALVLVSPLFLLWRDVEVLLILQALAVSGAGVGIYLAARERVGDSVSALLVQVAYHLAPATGWVVRDEFHPISLAMPAISFATALLWHRHFRLATLVGALALLSNEDATLWVAPFGLLIVAVGRRRGAIWGLGLAVGAITWLAAYMLVIVPAVRPPELGESVPHPNVGAFSQCGGSLTAVAVCLVRDPMVTVHQATTPGDRAALHSLLAPTAALGLLGPSFVVSWTRWLVLLLGNDPPNFRAHYVALLVPAVYLGAAEAIGWLRKRARRLAPSRLLATLVVAASFVAYLRVSPLPGGGESFAPPRQTPERTAVLDQAVSLIPTDASISVASTSSILPHLALRHQAYLVFEGRYAPPNYRIIDQRDPYPISREELRRHVALVRADPHYQLIFDRDDVLVFKHGYRPPDTSADETFGGAIHLLGYSVAPANGQVRIRLRWRAVAPIAHDYHFFVHLENGEHRGFSQKDGQLADGYLTATGWSLGTEVQEQIVIPAPPHSDWGRYHLDVGWYDLETGVRLKLPGDRDQVVLPLAATGK